jgi:hypothetical protein
MVRALNIGLFIGIAALLALVFFSTSFRQCIHAADGGSHLVMFRHCAAEFARHNGEAITALLTVVLALSTTFLWGATTKLYEAGKPQLAAAEKSADAAKLAAEVAQAQLNPVLWPRIVEAIIGYSEPVRVEEKPRIKLAFENLGGSTAFLESVQLAFIPDTQAPQDTPTKSALKPNRVVQRGSTSQAFDSQLTLTGQQMEAIKVGKLFLWLYGTVAFADVRGAQWETEFCFRYNGPENDLAPFPADRNKCTRKQAA